MPFVTGLFVYPVKSLKGIEVSSAEVGAEGCFRWDRYWLVVRPDGRFLTQRQVPRMALVETALPPEALLGDGWGGLSPDAALTLSVPSVAEPLQVPLQPPEDAPVKTVNVTCWYWTGVARDEGDAAAEWLSAAIGQPARLVRYIGQAGAGSADADPARRPIDEKWRKWGEGYEVTFPDQYPFLMACEESLHELNRRMPTPLPMNRFRPNIVISGGAAFAEDTWGELVIGRLDMQMRKPCGRCKVTTTDQATGAVGQEPLKTLKSFRTGKLLDWVPEPSWRHEVYFGWHMVTQSLGAVSVGDPVTVTRTRVASAEL